MGVMVQSAQASRCTRCRVRLSAKAVRCMQCGTRVIREEEKDAAQEALEKRQKLVRRYALNDTQKEILAAAAADDGSIFVCGSDGNTEGEVKAGQQRFYGNDAVAAIAALVVPGLISPLGGDRFGVTDAGRELVAVPV